jgi:hypothetical protein
MKKLNVLIELIHQREREVVVLVLINQHIRNILVMRQQIIVRLLVQKIIVELIVKYHHDQLSQYLEMI